MSDGNVRHRRVDQVGVERAELLRIVAALGHLVAILRIAQHGDEHFVELQIAAAGVGEAAHGLLVGLAEIVPEPSIVRIGLLVDRRHRRPAVDRRRRGNGDLRRALGVRGDELEMLDHRVRPGHAELAGDLDAFVARVRPPAKAMPAVHDVLLGAVEAPEEIEMPPRAAELAVGDRLQADVLLLLDDALDLAVLDRLQRVGRDLALGALAPAPHGCDLGRSRLPTWSARNGGLVRCIHSLCHARDAASSTPGR